MLIQTQPLTPLKAQKVSADFFPHFFALLWGEICWIVLNVFGKIY